jgi:hypothetical protein
VVAIEDGTVISSGVFTSPDIVPYWNRTFQATIAHVSGFFCRYAELGDLAMGPGDSLAGGEVIGHVGEVLDLSRIGDTAPAYLRALREHGHASMLHLEVFGSPPPPAPEYRGGNWFSQEKPAWIIDPVRILRDIP